MNTTYQKLKRNVCGKITKTKMYRANLRHKVKFLKNFNVL